MSAFDKRVCQWLGNASVPEKSKSTILNRMRVGILNYRSLELEKLTPNTTGKHSDNKSGVDYSLLDQINSALYRLEENETATDGQPLFPANDQAVRGNAAAAASNLRVEPDAEDGAPATSPSVTAAVATADSASADSPYASFKFGEEQDAPFSSSAGNEEAADADDGDDIDAGEVDDTEAEEIRRRIVKRQSRNAVSAEPINVTEAKQFKLPKFPKTPEVTQRLVKVLESHHLFAHLEDDEIVAVAESMILTTFKRGEHVATKGDSNDRMHLVVSGSVGVRDTEEKIQVGGSFGDVGLMYDVKHANTYEAAVAGTQVCSVDRSTYQALCAKSSQEKRERYNTFLSGVPSLKMLTPTERLQIADALKTSKYKKGEKIITYGDEGRWFYLIVEGSVNVVGRNDAGEEVHVCNFGEGMMVGELELLHKHRAVADCVAGSDVKVAKMTSRHFWKVIGPAKEFLERQAEEDAVYSYYRSSKRVSS